MVACTTELKLEELAGSIPKAKMVCCRKVNLFGMKGSFVLFNFDAPTKQSTLQKILNIFIRRIENKQPKSQFQELNILWFVNTRPSILDEHTGLENQNSGKGKDQSLSPHPHFTCNGIKVMQKSHGQIIHGQSSVKTSYKLQVTNSSF